MAETGDAGVVREADLVVDGRRWHYHQAGRVEAPPVLLVHGYRSSGVFFRGLMAALADRWRTLAPDLPGHGSSEPWDPEEPAVEQWELLSSFLDEVRVDEFAVLGSSRGGAVALQLAARHVDRVGALLMVAAPPHPFKVGTLDVGRMVVDRAVLTPRLMEELRHTFQASKGYEVARARAIEEGRLERDLRPIMGSVRAPAMVLWGEADPTIPVELADVFLDNLPDAQLVVVSDAGHMPLLERPTVCQEAIRSFLRSRWTP